MEAEFPYPLEHGHQRCVYDTEAHGDENNKEPPEDEPVVHLQNGRDQGKQVQPGVHFVLRPRQFPPQRLRNHFRILPARKDYRNFGNGTSQLQHPLRNGHGHEHVLLLRRLKLRLEDPDDAKGPGGDLLPRILRHENQLSPKAGLELLHQRRSYDDSEFVPRGEVVSLRDRISDE